MLTVYSFVAPPRKGAPADAKEQPAATDASREPAAV
jgi:hypothetical protein